MTDSTGDAASDLAAFDEVIAARHAIPGFGEMSLAPVSVPSLRSALRSLAGRLRRSDIPYADRAYLALAESALQSGIESPEKGYLPRMTLWVAIRRARRVVRPKTYRLLVDTYDATQAGRPEWLSHTAGMRALTGDAGLVLATGELAIETPGAGLRVPAGRMLRIAGWDLRPDDVTSAPVPG